MSVLNAEGLVKVYNKKHVAVNGIDLEITRGEVVGFLGPNGAGKSTTIKMIIGLLEPTAGNLEVLDQHMPAGRGVVRHKVGYIPQDLVFMEHLTVRENARLFGKAYNVYHLDERIEEVFNLLGLTEFQDRISSELSGGQKRRLNVALGLLHSPELLVMDEPSAGMDPQSRNILWETIEALSGEDITIILTTHLMDIVDRLADRVCIVDHGKVLAVGSPQELKQTYGTKEVIELVIDDRADPSYRASVVTALSTSFPNEVVSDRKEFITISLQNGLSSFQKILDVLGRLGTDHITQVRARQSTLEDVFITLTGRDLRED